MTQNLNLRTLVRLCVPNRNYSPACTCSLLIFGDISKVQPPFENEMFRYFFLFVHLSLSTCRIKTIDWFQKPEVYFAFNKQRFIPEGS